MDENALLNGLRNGDSSCYDELQTIYEEDLIIFAFLMLHDGDKAHETVERMLRQLFKNNGFTDATLPLHAFLYKKLRVECDTEIWNSYAGPETGPS